MNKRLLIILGIVLLLLIIGGIAVSVMQEVNQATSMIEIALTETSLTRTAIGD
jgi:hypothetical protein